MKPIAFKGQNIVFGADQPEYLPLPALRMPDGEVITCWELDAAEIESIVKNKCFYLSQLSFNQPLQPIRPMANLEDGIEFQ